MAYWLMKSEPHVYNIDSLEKKRCEMWGKSVRNYQARNMMRDDMKIGDEIFFYQSRGRPKLDNVPDSTGFCL